jgi:hypothetical protein
MRGADLLRLKAIVAITERPSQPVVLHGVQHLFHAPVLLPEWPSEDHRTRIVFITRDLPRATIEQSLTAFEEGVEESPSPKSSPRERSEAGTRRDFLVSAGAVAAATAFTGSAHAVMKPDDKFDLVIKGGEVLDPSQSLRGKRDIGIRYGIVEALEPEIPAARALRVLDASGKLVTPGLIDLHAHVYPYGSAIGHSGRRARHPSVHNDLRIGRRCRSQQFRGVPPFHRGRDAHSPLCLHTYCPYWARALPGSRAHQH